MNAYLLLVLALLLVSVGCQRSADAGESPVRPERTAGSAAAGKTPATNPAPGEPVGKIEKSDEEWRKTLSPEEYQVLRQKGTERAFTGKYDHHFEKGAYVCAACGLELFTSDTKFDSGCGWPAFYAAKAGDRVKLIPDYSHGMSRVEVDCARCGSHLGHIFDDAPNQPTGQRYCINSVSMKFIPAADPKAAPTTKPSTPAR